MNKKIDLVYLWVDGSDEKWAEKKANALAKYKGIALNKDTVASCRFLQNDELKYSLRSVEKYASWINHIYIVTDNQVPKWLNLDNPKITIVNQNEIMPSKFLPCFNSCAIETHIINIQNLSDDFLYANDDMFFWNKVSPSFFFDEKNRAVCVMDKKIKNREYKHQYGHTVVKAYKLVRDRLGVDVPYFPHHGIDAYKKLLLKQCNEFFYDEIEETKQHKFRDFEDVQRAIYQYFMIAKQEGVLSIPKKKSFFEKLFKSDVEYVSCKISSLKKAYKSKSEIMCINDGRKTTDADRRFMKEILEKKFGEKSSFEL